MPKYTVYSLMVDFHNSGTEVLVYPTESDRDAQLVSIMVERFGEDFVQWDADEKAAIERIRALIEEGKVGEAWEMFRDHDGNGNSICSSEDYFTLEQHEVEFAEPQRKDAHAREQALAQLASIREMVAGLEIESAARAFALTKEPGDCALLLDAAGIQYNVEAGVALDLQQELADALADGRMTLPEFEFDDEKARQAINEDALSIEVRSDWYLLDSREAQQPIIAEFCILLCTGGPACRIIGKIEDGDPCRPRLEYQDWGTPWTELPTSDEDDEKLLAYVNVFYFGS